MEEGRLTFFCWRMASALVMLCSELVLLSGCLPDGRVIPGMLRMSSTFSTMQHSNTPDWNSVNVADGSCAVVG